MSVFAGIPEGDWVASNDLAFAVRDSFPVTPGHTLVITRRVVTTWFDASIAEQQAVMALVDAVKAELDRTHQPDGYNVGFNAGSAAGQTVPHLHVHVIPRYAGDMPDPRGGVRHVIPSRGNYLAEPRRALITPDRGRMRDELARCLTDSSFDRVDLLVAFVMRSGVEVLREHIEAALARGARIRLLTTDYLAVTDVGALGYFLDRLGAHPDGGHLEVRVFAATSRSFHPKAYLFLTSAGGTGVAFVGSSNLSRSALQHGIEWNLETSAVAELATEFDELWDHPQSTELSVDWLAAYDARRTILAGQRVEHPGELAGNEESEAAIRPWSVQTEALEALSASRLDGHRAGLVVMATGLGKTWLAAFDSTRPGIGRVLFVAHREEILASARDVFRRVRPGGTFTMFVGGEQDLTGDVVFASIQSLQQHLDRFAADEFDYIVVDEFHHAAAPTYRRVIGHFTPRFLLGLTATPDRTDAADLLALCDDNLVYECGLVVGLQRGLLSPFRYRAIRDVADYEHIPWRSGRFAVDDLTVQLATQQRAEQVIAEWETLGGSGRRAIGFCCSIAHADYMRDQFRSHGYRAASVHTGATSDDRSASLHALEDGDLDVVFSVDLFNEGIDLPAIDIVLMLRPTESPIVFFQQLGRGLRKMAGKSHLDVLDLVGNHRGFLIKARILAALSGLTHPTDREAVARLREPLTEVPEGCSITVDTEAVDLLASMLGTPRRQDRALDLVRAWMDDHDGVRPTALEMALASGGGIDLGRKRGGWFGFLAEHGLLTDDEQRVFAQFGEVLVWIEHGAYSKSFKLVTLQALAAMGSLREPASMREVAVVSRWRIFSDPRLLNDLADAAGSFVDVLNPTEGEWFAYWRKNPIAALTGDAGWFTVNGDALAPTYSVPADLGAVFDRMLGEIVDYRLHRYLVGKEARRPSVKLQPTASDGQVLDASFRIETALGEPLSILFESAGGTKASKNARNVDYARGIDTVLQRLASAGAVILDAYVDSSTTRSLPIAARRVVDAAQPLPISITADEVMSLRKGFLRRMAKVGQARGVRGGGNQRKALRVVLGGLDHLTTAALARLLVDGVGRDDHVDRDDRAGLSTIEGPGVSAG